MTAAAWAWFPGDVTALIHERPLRADRKYRRCVWLLWVHWLSTFLLSHFSPLGCCCCIWRQKARMPKTKRNRADITLCPEHSLGCYSVWFVIKRSWERSHSSVPVSSPAQRVPSLHFASPDSKLPENRTIVKRVYITSIVALLMWFNNLPSSDPWWLESVLFVHKW